jgi:hypothetical protein
MIKLAAATLFTGLAALACTHGAKKESAVTEAVTTSEPAAAPAAYTYDPVKNSCTPVSESPDTILDRMRGKAGDECFNLINTDLGFTRVMCPQIQVQLIVATNAEACMKGNEEKIPDYKTIDHAGIDTLAKPTPEQLANFKMKVLRGPLAMYRYHTGTFPKDDQGLQALLTNPPGIVGWQGPYVQDASGFKDSWDTELKYMTYDNGKRYKLISLGADKTLGTKDDQEFVPYPKPN